LRAANLICDEHSALPALTNRAVLYNFLSSFSGTHFISPRAVQAEMTFHF
jgi:hypothetical protein